MKRFLVLAFLGAVAAVGLWFGIRGNSTRGPSAMVTALLPRETLALVHVPDFKRARENWHETDLYKLWREPAVQEFLRKPLAGMPQAGAAREKMRELDALDMKDGFLAITSWEDKQVKMLAGFRFKGSAANAEKVIGNWRARAQTSAPGAKRETVPHEGHQIEVMSREGITVATVYDGAWFFAANDVAALKRLLDRADKRLDEPVTTLAKDEHFIAALKHMPARYAAFAYGRPDAYFERLARSMPENVINAGQWSRLRQLRGIAVASTFERGRFRDVAFAAMPKIDDSGDLTRKSLALGTKDSFFYSAAMVALGKQMASSVGASPGAVMPAALQNLAAAFAASGITAADWDSAFGAELSILGEWPDNARFPALLMTLPVKDAAKASQIAAAFTSAGAGERTWEQSERDGVQYFSLPPENPLVPVSPTIGISQQLLALGLDQGSVEAAFKRSTMESGLSGTQKFRTAEGLVPIAKQSFTYIDTALLYQRLDSALRPMLVMAAAFVPKIAETVDLSKLPPAEVIMKHLTPIVTSQSYQSDGYVTESIGPVSICQALGIVGVSGAGAALYQQQVQPGGANLGGSPTVPPALPSSSAAAPEPEPEETP